MSTDNTQAQPPAAEGATRYSRFDTGAEFQQAIETLLDQPGRELRIFDPDMQAFRLNSPERITRLEHFLQASRTHRLYLVVHDPGHIVRSCPRMLLLLSHFSHAIQINRTDDSIRELQDSFAVFDDRHYLRRPVARFFRGSIGVNDETEARVMRSRFMEIWAASFPGVSSTTAGL
ncbi:MAG: hypothetical protein HY017_06100 [Betaproteobacteria bacterium]|nr:hypothetical protein [Betaproteobacteria bacterium]